MTTQRRLSFILALSMLCASVASCGSEESNSSFESACSEKSITSNSMYATISTTDETAQFSTDIPTTSETNTVEMTTEETEWSYVSNEYYDIVEMEEIKDLFGYTIMIHKLLAKQNTFLDATAIAYDSEGNVIDKVEEHISLVKDKYNYLEFQFHSDVSDDKVLMNVSFDDEFYSYICGDPDGIEMVKYNQNGDHLYITLKQTSDKIGISARYKLLFYKNDKIIGTKEGSFTYAHLNGIGSTDVIDIRLSSDLDYDRFEYIYEP